MARAIWSGAISFGLVNVPIKVFSAVSAKEVRFHQLHDEDGARLQYKRVCSKDGEEVPYEHIVKGFEIAPDEYVMITPEELEALAPESTRLIDIEEFVALDDIDPLYFEKSYYLAPNKGGSKAYSVLLEAMRTSGKVAIGRVVLRTKQYLVALRPLENALVMTTMNYADEIVSQSSLDDLPDGKVDATEKELTMAQQLIEALTGDFEPGKYHDEHRQRVLDLIEAKAEGAETVTQPSTSEPNIVGDLMAALEQSLQATRSGSDTKPSRPRLKVVKGEGSGTKARKDSESSDARATRAAAAGKKTKSTKKVAPAKKRSSGK